MKYIKRILKAFLFILGLLGIFIVSSFIFLPKINVPDTGIEEARANGISGEKDNSVDVVILGDSESYSAFIPLQLWKDTGYTSYICGTSGQTLDYSKVMLKRAFKKQSPKIVILETCAFFREPSEMDVLYTELSELFPVFRYHDRWKTLRLDDFIKTPEYTWSDNNKGYRFSTAVSPSQKTGYMKATKSKKRVTAFIHDSVKEIKKLCDDNGAKLILISTPSTKNWNFYRHNGVSELSSELGCEFIDMNLLTKEIPIDWNNDTRDKGDHLNYFGARKVTEFLADYLKATGLLESHKVDPDYKKWDDAFDLFEYQIRNNGIAPMDTNEKIN